MSEENDTLNIPGIEPEDKGLAAFDKKATEPADTPAPKRRGRPPGSKTKRKPAAKKTPEPEPEPIPHEPIDPELISALFSATFNPLCHRADVPELDAEELKAGGEAWAPILDHYFPSTAAKLGIWAAPVLWTLATSLPRIDLALEARRAREKAGKGGDPNATPFRTESASASSSPKVEKVQGTVGAVVSETEIEARKKVAKK